jgi:hypothetical protein
MLVKNLFEPMRGKLLEIKERYFYIFFGIYIMTIWSFAGIWFNHYLQCDAINTVRSYIYLAISLSAIAFASSLSVLFFVIIRNERKGVFRNKKRGQT